MKKLFFISILLNFTAVLPEQNQAELGFLDALNLNETDQDLDSSFVDTLSQEPELFLLDKIDCVVCGPAGSTVFTDTDQTWKRTLDSRFVPIQKLIQDDIIKQQVVSEKMPLDPEAIVKHIENIKKQVNVNDAQLEQLFADVGCMMQEGIEMFRQQYMTEFFTYYKFKSQMVANDEEIEKYFEEYPEFIDGNIEFQMASVLYDQQDYKKIKKELNQYLKNPEKQPANLFWGPTLKLIPEELSTDQKFLLTMDLDQIKIIEKDGVFELYKVIAYDQTRVKTLAERRNEIIEKLNRRRLEEMLKAYNDTVQEFIDIIRL